MDHNEKPGDPSGNDQQQSTQPNTAAQIGNVPLLGVLVFSILVLIPATRPTGIAMLLLLAIPILIGWVRARKLTDGSRGLTTANATICGLMVIVGAAMSPTTSSAPAETTVADTAPAPQLAPPPNALTAPPPIARAPQLATPSSAAPPNALTAPAPGAPAATQKPIVAPAPPAALAPVATRATPAPVKPAPATVEKTPQPPAGMCGGDSYTNSDGNCVHRPKAASSAPSGATAKCKDGKYSFSQHRQGTCSGHGGVASWL